MGGSIHAGESRIEFSDGGEAAVSGPLTFELVPDLFHILERRQASEPPVQAIDLQGVSSVDSAGLALLLEWQARASASGRQIRVRNAPGSLLRLARLSEAVDLLQLSAREGED